MQSSFIFHVCIVCLSFTFVSLRKFSSVNFELSTAAQLRTELAKRKADAIHRREFSDARASVCVCEFWRRNRAKRACCDRNVFTRCGGGGGCGCFSPPRLSLRLPPPQQFFFFLGFRISSLQYLTRDCCGAKGNTRCTVRGGYDRSRVAQLTYTISQFREKRWM